MTLTLQDRKQIAELHKATIAVLNEIYIKLADLERRLQQLEMK